MSKRQESPKVSVIMSVYNGMPFLEEAVKSVLGQTYKNFEFIIIDDASTDESWNYLQKLRDKRVKITKNEKNMGLAASLNIALKRAQGDYVARMDADDVSLPKRFQVQIEYMQLNPLVDMCGTWVDLIDKEGNVLGEKKYPTTNKAIKKSLVYYSPIVHPTLIIKSNVLRQLNGYNPKFDMAEDYELLSRAKNKFRMSNVPQKLLLWRLEEERRSRREMRKMDKIELSVKLEALRRDGLTLSALLGLSKKLLLTYLLPFPLKLQIAKLLKLA